ncbi:hypothetical protein PDIP_51750 [Penicillium digitatum Pd1]|uniref:Uncharacterized protein n=1 Tax=Penicillium digitatum (strain Pd1 / CECT 20795) TaxID=1170230 RepID=K9GCK4_PEND1|nr:hypothetical protein PDIP_51750 [Penicillium digitatum Pd1]EKV12588.1 hypothetical protein PDIP_51750 [Penicillium digitatum Pd1]
MADLGGQRSRNYRPHGPASSTQRDAAYSDIFGGAPPAGRSHTMNSQTPQFSQARAHTMSSHVTQPQFQRPPPPPTRQMPNGQGPPSAPPNGYPIPPQSGQYQAYNPGASATMSSYQPPRHNPNTQQRFAAYPRPQRLESRPSPTPQYPDLRDFNRAMPPPALNSDSSRSRSMAKLSGPPYQTPQATSITHLPLPLAVSSIMLGPRSHSSVDLSQKNMRTNELCL